MNQNMIETTSGLNELKRKNIEDISVNNDSKRQIMSSEWTQNSQKLQCLSINTKLSEIKIPQLKNKIIYKLVYDRELIVAASHGMLLKYDGNYTHVYQTNTENDFVEVELIKREKTFYIVGFTKNKIYVYHTNDVTPHVILDISDPHNSELKYVFNDNNVIFMVLSNGNISILKKEKWNTFYYVNNTIPTLRHIFPRILKNKWNLLTLEDSLLYKSKKNGVKNLEIIDGVKDVKDVLRCRREYICISDHNVWLLDSKHKVVDSLSFVCDIKLSNISDNRLVVVDVDNTVHLYSYNSGGFDKKYFERKVKGNVSAVIITFNKVRIAVDDSLFIIN